MLGELLHLLIWVGQSVLRAILFLYLGGIPVFAVTYARWQKKQFGGIQWLAVILLTLGWPFVAWLWYCDPPEPPESEGKGDDQSGTT